MTETPPKPPVAAHWTSKLRGFARELALALVLVTVVTTAVSAWRTRDVPAQLPDLTLTATDGMPLRLADWQAEHPNQAVVIYLWADWCPVCAAQAPLVENVMSALPLLTVAQQSGPPDTVARSLAMTKRQWPTVVDETGALAAQLNLPGVPAWLVIGPTGQVRFAEAGLSSPWGIRLRAWWAEQFS